MADSEFNPFAFLRDYIVNPDPERVNALKPAQVQEISEITFVNHGGLDRVIVYYPESKRAQSFCERFERGSTNLDFLQQLAIKIDFPTDLLHITDLKTALANSAYYGRLQTIRTILELHPEADTPSNLVDIVYPAVNGGQIEVYNFLISRGAVGFSVSLILRQAISSRNLAMVQVVCPATPTPRRLRSALKVAATSGTPQIMEYLLTFCDLEFKLAVKLYSESIYGGNIAVGRYLEKYIDFQHPKIQKMSEAWLEYAFDDGNLDIVDYLVSLGFRATNKMLQYFGEDSPGVRRYRQLLR